MGIYFLEKYPHKPIYEGANSDICMKSNFVSIYQNLYIWVIPVTDKEKSPI